MAQRTPETGISNPDQTPESTARVAESGALASERRLDRLLVAVDLGDGSDHVIRFARRMAGPSAEIMLVHVVCDLESLLDAYVCKKPLPELQSDLVIEGKARLRRLAQECFEGMRPPREFVLNGTAWSEIVATARRHHADAIVIGSQSQHEPADHHIVGGTVARVLWHAPCAVVVVPPEEE
ncbi:MAG: universal stress protein [Planctomycetes bacterium]|nr:universal stress protein [Planctomycetota bacterium]